MLLVEVIGGLGGQNMMMVGKIRRFVLELTHGFFHDLMNDEFIENYR